jgi:hypothetical protein
MKTPEKPASSAARDHSSRRAGGLSGSIVQASAVLAMVNFLSSDLRRHFHQAAVSVKPLDFFDRRIVQINESANDEAVFTWSHPKPGGLVR